MDAFNGFGKPSMSEPDNLLYGLLKTQMEEMEASREKYEAEAEKRKATVETIIGALDGYSWEDAEGLLKFAEREMKQRFFVMVNKVVTSEDIKV